MITHRLKFTSPAGRSTVVTMHCEASDRDRLDIVCGCTIVAAAKSLHCEPRLLTVDPFVDTPIRDLFFRLEALSQVYIP